MFEVPTRTVINAQTNEQTNITNLTYDGERKVEFNKNWRFKREIDGNIEDLDYPYTKTSATAGAYEQNNATEGDPNFAVDNDSSTIFHSPWDGTEKSNLWITLELEEVTKLDTLRYLSRSGSSNGIVNEYIVETSLDNERWEEVSIGQWSNRQNKWLIAEFDEAQKAKYVRLTAKSTYGDKADKFMTADEIRVRIAEDTEVDEKAAEEVSNLLATLPTKGNVTLEDKDAIEAGRTAYDALTEAEQDLVVGYAKNRLTNAEAELEVLKGKRDATQVKRRIYNLPKASELTLKDKEAVKEVRVMYDDLSEEAKALVTTISQLEAREDKLTELAN